MPLTEKNDPTTHTRESSVHSVAHTKGGKLGGTIRQDQTASQHRMQIPCESVNFLQNRHLFRVFRRLFALLGAERRGYEGHPLRALLAVPA
jgi:hypothetical protein